MESLKSLIAKSFLESLPKLPSHYCRQKSFKLFLETSIVSQTQLYKLCQAFSDTKGVHGVLRPVLMQKAKELNIGIFSPRKDQCNICLSHSHGLCLEDEFQIHFKHKEEAQEEKAKDKQAAQHDPTILVITMNLQVVLLVQKHFAIANHFKTKLCCHNLTINDLNIHQCQCHLRREVIGDVMRNTFSSCVKDFIKTILNRQHVKSIIIFASGCGYQNWNVVLPNCLMHQAIESKVTITQKFFQRGHT